MIEWKPRAEALAAELSEVGAVRDPAWWAAFAATPRHVFVPPVLCPGPVRPAADPGHRRRPGPAGDLAGVGLP